MTFSAIGGYGAGRISSQTSLPSHISHTTFLHPYLFSNHVAPIFSPQPCLPNNLFSINQFSPLISHRRCLSSHKTISGGLYKIAFAVISTAYRDFLLLSLTKEARDNINLLTRVFPLSLKSFLIISIYYRELLLLSFTKETRDNTNLWSRVSFVAL